MNPPSAWAVAKRDAPQIAEQLWTHGFPVGPKGRYAPFLPYFWGVWNFSKNQSAAKSLITFLSQPSSAEKMTNASQGYDLPSFEKLTTFKVWAEESPPKGTLYHYPNPHNHQTLSIAAAPAPHKIAEQIYTQAIQTQMVVRYAKGEGHGQDARLGGQGARGLQPQLMRSCPPVLNRGSVGGSGIGLGIGLQDRFGTGVRAGPALGGTARRFRRGGTVQTVLVACFQPGVPAWPDRAWSTRWQTSPPEIRPGIRHSSAAACTSSCSASRPSPS